MARGSLKPLNRPGARLRSGFLPIGLFWWFNLWGGVGMEFIKKLKAHILNGGKIIYKPNRKGESVWAGQVCANCFKEFPRPYGYPEYCSECDDMAVKKILGREK